MKKERRSEAFLIAYRGCGNVTEACRLARVGRTAVYEWRAEDPAFAAAWEEANEVAVEQLEMVARQRALDSSDTLLIFLLKANRPAKYRETIKIDWRNITEEQLLALAGGGPSGADSPGDRLAQAEGVPDESRGLSE